MYIEPIVIMSMEISTKNQLIAICIVFRHLKNAWQ